MDTPTIKAIPRTSKVRLYWPMSGNEIETPLHHTHDGVCYVEYHGKRFEVVGLPDKWLGREVECRLEKTE